MSFQSTPLNIWKVVCVSHEPTDSIFIAKFKVQARTLEDALIYVNELIDQKMKISEITQISEFKST